MEQTEIDFFAKNHLQNVESLINLKVKLKEIESKIDNADLKIEDIQSKLEELKR